MGQSWAAPKRPSNATQLLDFKPVPNLIAYDGAWYGMLVLAGSLLTLCALLAGLTLAVCGLNSTSLKLRCVTGTPKQRQQALVVARMKSHHSWMLCSLVILSVLCSESLPFVIQSLWDEPNQWWVPIIVSTLSIAFVAEIAPQYWVPRRAIEWGYYCWPLIWGSMWTTCIISWPIAKLLDYCSGMKDEVSIFSNNELAGFIKYHEKAEKNGGMVGQDTSRVMLGALSLDGRKLGATFSAFPKTGHAGSSGRGSDVEKADLVVVNGMIVNWSIVKTVDIDEPVDNAFIRKIKSWSYSRIPVVGEAQVEQEEAGENRSFHTSWNARKVFGVLHVKTLIGLKIPDKHNTTTSTLVVRDLQLYPLPIVMDDMSAYALFNMFHLGISRMAVVIPTPERTAIGEIVIPDKPAKSGQPQATCWTGTQRTNNLIQSSLRRMNMQTDWSKGFLDGALGDIDNLKRYHVTGIRCSEPLGIITFEDILAMILQKTSRDERDFYDNRHLHRTKSKNVGDCETISTLRRLVLHPMSKHAAVQPKSHDTHLLGLKSEENNTLRKRNPSYKAPASAMDGADERSVHTPIEIKVKEKRREYTGSFYTQNSRGGFHRSNDSLESGLLLTMTPVAQSTSGELDVIRRTVPSPQVNSDLSPQAAASLPSRKEQSPFLPGEFNPVTRRYVSAMPKLPNLRRVTPFTRVDCSSFAEQADAEHLGTVIKREGSGLRMPNPSKLGEQLRQDTSSIDSNDNDFDFGSVLESRDKCATLEDSSDTISVSSCCQHDPNAFDIDDLNSRAYSKSFVRSILADIHGDRVKLERVFNSSHSDITEDLTLQTNKPKVTAAPYDGFPPELLDRNGEDQLPNLAFMTLPRKLGMGELDSPIEPWGCGTHTRDGSFHDDRALLPSQRQNLNSSADMMLGATRRTSFWF